MKKIAAILLIIILSFNWYGYRLLTNFLATNADVKLEARLDNSDYNENDLIEIKVALNVPYLTSQAEFERHSGEIEVGGQLYSYVKRKIDNGFLILKCIPNDTKQHIRKAGNDYFKMSNGLDQSSQDGKKQNGNNVLKTVTGDCDDQLNNYEVSYFASVVNRKHFHDAFSLYHTTQSTTEHPPDAISIS